MKTTEITGRDGECITKRDFNGHAGSSVHGFKEVYGGCKWSQRNQEGKKIAKLVGSFDMSVGNTYLKKDKKSITFKSEYNVMTVDYILLKRF